LPFHYAPIQLSLKILCGCYVNRNNTLPKAIKPMTKSSAAIAGADDL
jgi:hypothetical protein